MNDLDNTIFCRQSIFDCKFNVIGYEMLFRNSWSNKFPEGVNSTEATKSVVDAYIQCGAQMTDNAFCFVNFDYFSLINNLPSEIINRYLVIEVLESCKPDLQLLSALKRYFENGYKIALDDFSFDACWDDFLPYVSIIKVCLLQTDVSNPYIQSKLRQLKRKGITLLAEKVETKNDMLLCLSLGFTYFQGFYLARPEILERPLLSKSLTSRSNLAPLLHY